MEIVDFARVAKRIAGQARELVHGKCGTACIGGHVRHVLDSASPRVEVVTIGGSEGEANDLRVLTSRRGLPTLNHVLDGLLYGRSFSLNGAATRLPGKEYIALRLTYSMAGPDSCHLFEEDEEERHRFSVWKTRLGTGSAESMELRESCGSELQFSRWGVRWEADPLLDVQSDDPWAFPAEMFDPPDRLFTGYVCGAQKLCDRLDVRPSPVAYRGIMSALYQLGLWSEKFGREIITVCRRPMSDFDLASGVTVISDEPIPVDVVSNLINLLTAVPGFEEAEEARKEVEKWAGARFKGVEDDACSKVAAKLMKRMPELAGVPEDAIAQSFSSLLNMSVSLCDEQLEGRALRFGLVLGNPGLMGLWPGPPPMPLTGMEDGKRRAPEWHDVPKYVHVAEDPAERCLVLQYLNGALDRKTRTPVSVLDLARVREALPESALGVPWRPEFLPYVFLTREHPWALAAVVGPGAEVRVFQGGELVAYRNGKGWQVKVDPDPDLETSFAGLSDLLHVALQLSPIARPESHGGLLVYGCDPDQADDLDFGPDDDHIRSLRSLEPEVPVLGGTGGAGVPWLTGRTLFRPADRRGGSRRLDAAVFRRLVEASALDGATVLSGPEAVVRGFARNLTFPGDRAISDPGTKGAAMTRFLCWMSGRSRRGIGVKVSSDGPVTWGTTRSAVEAKRRSLFVAIEEAAK